MITLQLWIAVGILAWIYFLWSRRRFYLLMLRVKGPVGYPFLGNVIGFLRSKRNIGLAGKFAEIYGPTFLTWMGTVPVLVTSEPNVIQDILTSPYCLDKSQTACNAIIMNSGPGILALRGSHWVERRRKMIPSFKKNVVMSFLPIFNEETNSLLSVLDTYVGQGEREILPDVLNWSFRTAYQTTLGSDVKANTSFKNGTLLKNFKYIMENTTLAILFPLVQNRTIAKLLGIEKRRTEAAFVVNELTKSLIEEKMTNKPDENQESLAIRNTVISRVVEFLKSGEFSYEDAEGECSIMVGASFETTAVTVFSTLAFLAMFPEYQDAAFVELKDVFPNAGDFEVSNDEIQKLVYLDRVLNESMRLIPAIPLIARETSQEVKLSNGILLPKSLTLCLDIFHTHRNKDSWGPEAHKFNPDNFLPENISKIHQYAYIPFNKGKRSCIGMKYAEISAKVALSKILRNYKLSTSFRTEDFVFIENLSIDFAKKPLLELQRRD
ncbi:probable cytochrome P450 313a1 isoform X1 [Drosophila miranda]|uniref:probable cytochrome P450 313a1 isoform X1 n=1 Tax=Drosophila miranda TaxID=7229 RepID=UPI0007E88D52|nr:probable cytochrome P450 313a1 isoform X1 [Drosophila miranda]